jgi:hypothetical protein
VGYTKRRLPREQQFAIFRQVAVFVLRVLLSPLETGTSREAAGGIDDLNRHLCAKLATVYRGYHTLQIKKARFGEPKDPRNKRHGTSYCHGQESGISTFRQLNPGHYDQLTDQAASRERCQCIQQDLCSGPDLPQHAFAVSCDGKQQVWFVTLRRRVLRTRGK